MALWWRKKKTYQGLNLVGKSKLAMNGKSKCKNLLKKNELRWRHQKNQHTEAGPKVNPVAKNGLISQGQLIRIHRKKNPKWPVAKRGRQHHNNIGVQKLKIQVKTATLRKRRIIIWKIGIQGWKNNRERLDFRWGRKMTSLNKRCFRILIILIQILKLIIKTT